MRHGHPHGAGAPLTLYSEGQRTSEIAHLGGQKTLRTGYLTSQGQCDCQFHREAGRSKQSHRSWLSLASEETFRNDNDIPTEQEQDFLLCQAV